MYDQIRKLCEENNVSVQQLSRDIDVSKNTIGRWDTNSPSVDKVMKVADYFNVSMDYLCGRTEKKEPTGGDGEFADMDVSENEYELILMLRRIGDNPIALDSLTKFLSALPLRSADPAAKTAEN